MTKRIHLVVLGVSLLLATSIVGASAFTSATIQRDAQITVQNDANAIIGLDANENVPGVTENTDGELSLNLDEDSGLNPGATFTFGNSTNGVAAFVVANNGTDEYEVSFEYDLSDSSNDGSDDANVQFAVYDETWGSTVATFNEETDYSSTTPSTTLASGNQRYVVVTVTTDGDSTDLSGTLTVSASPSST
jgi:hypothetical protein